MKILLGDTRARTLVAQIRERGWGRMFAERHPTPWDGEPWGFDNGAFGAWLNQRPFPADQFLSRLDRALNRDVVPYIAVVPDLVAEGLRSLEFSLGWVERLPTGWPWYLAVQDGMSPRDVAPELVNFRGIFLGGTVRFKSTAARWRELAHSYGLKFHYARAGTPNRIQHALAVGADSLDSSFPLWTNVRFQEFIAELASPRSPVLPLVKEWLATAGIYACDPLTGCAP